MTTPALFEARDLHKRFGDPVVLENIDLGFPENRLSGIIGPNGAGKTNCFNVLTGRYRPDFCFVTLIGWVSAIGWPSTVC